MTGARPAQLCTRTIKSHQMQTIMMGEHSDRGDSDPIRAQRAVAQMLTGQQMAAAGPTEADIDIATRQVAGEFTGNETVAKAIDSARASFHNA